MKTLNAIIVALAALFTSTTYAQQQTSTFKVAGNCDMCKSRIEKAAKLPGVQSFQWNPELQVAKLSFDSTKVSLDAIQQKIAAAGYDTEKYTADKKAYNSLPGCCQYERLKSEEKKHSH